MGRKELIERAVRRASENNLEALEKFNLPREEIVGIVRAIIPLYEQEIIEQVKDGEKVILDGFLTFKLKDYAPRQLVDFQTGESREVTPRTVRCSVSKKVKDYINGRETE